MMPYPYTNTHELNLDWIIGIVKDFQNNYSGISEALDQAIAAITEKGEATEADIEALRIAAAEAIQIYQENAIRAVNAAQTAGVAALDNLIQSLPGSSEEMLGQLQIINSILNGTQSEAPTWAQGAYQYNTTTQQYEIVSTPYNVCSVMQGGCNGRKVRIVSNTAAQKISAVWWWDSAKTIINQVTMGNVSSAEYTFPQTASYFSIVLAGAGEISVAQTNVSVTWYSEISKINTLYNAIINMESEQECTDEILLAYGCGWYGAIGSPASLQTGAPYNVRVANPVPYKLPKGDYTIHMSDGWRISFRTLNASNIVQSDSGWITADYAFSADGETLYAFTGSNPANTATSLEEYLQHFNMYRKITVIDEIKRLAPSEVANVKSVNHRGFNTLAPENTLPAFKLSRKMGFRYVETDVRFTSDGVPVLLHDATINRTARNADGSQIAGTINIADITYQQALTYDFGIWKGAEYAGTKIPTLAQFMRLCRDIGITPRIELNVLTLSNAESMYNVIDSCGMAEKVEYNCNSLEIAQYFLQRNPKAVIVYGLGEYDGSAINAVGALKTINNTIIVNMLYTAINSTAVATCRALGVQLEAWTVDDAQTIIGLDNYISGVTSNSLIASDVLYTDSM